MFEERNSSGNIMKTAGAFKHNLANLTSYKKYNLFDLYSWEVPSMAFRGFVNENDKMAEDN